MRGHGTLYGRRKSAAVIMNILVLLLLASFAGIIYPYIKGMRRKHFFWSTLGIFIFSGVMYPKLDPEGYKQSQEKAAAEEKQEALAEASEASKTASVANAAAKQARKPNSNSEVLAKAGQALEERLPYSRSEYPKLYSQIGSATFAKLNTLEEGAIYHAAESENCSKVLSSGTSDTSRPGAAMFFIDCDDQQRFMVTQSEAEEALKRFKNKTLALHDLSASCTWRSVSECSPTAAEPLPFAREASIVDACDRVLNAGHPDAASIETLGNGRRDYSKAGFVRISRIFVANNASGKSSKASYECNVRLGSDEVRSLTVTDPTGTKKYL